MGWLFPADGFDHWFTASPGAVTTDGGPITVMSLVYPINGNCGLLAGMTAASAYEWEINGDTSKWFGTGDFSGLATMTLNTWQWIGYSKATGSAAMRWHNQIYSGGSWGTWAHTAGSVIADGASATDHLQYGLSHQRTQGRRFIDAVWNTVLTDLAVEAACVTGNSLMAATPAACWQCNLSPAGGLIDLTGGGANSTGLTGTAPTLDTTQEPPSPFAYYSAASSTPAKGAFFQFLGA